MAFDFPASPTPGQIYAPAGGPTYTWNGSAWGANLPAFATADTRNRIVNPAMQISQENGFDASISANNAHTADQWQFAVITGGSPVTLARSNDPAPHPHYLRINASSVIDTAIAAGDLVSLYQRLEGIRLADFQWGTSSAKPAVARFSARCVTVPSLVIGFAIRAYANDAAFTKLVTLTTAWQDFVIPIPPCGIGTWPKDTSLTAMLYFCGMAGSTWATGTDGAWAANSALAPSSGLGNVMAVASSCIDVANVGLHLDPNNTGLAPPWQTPDEAEELRACQRYWQTFYGIFSSQVTTATNYFANTPYAVAPRPGALLSGVNVANTSFPATVGTLALMAGSARENRTSNATAALGTFSTTYTLNARM